MVVRVPVGRDLVRLAVVIPIHGDQGDAALDKPPRQEQALAELGRTVAFASFARFTGQIERIGSLGAINQLPGRLIMLSKELQRMSRVAEYSFWPPRARCNSRRC